MFNSKIYHFLFFVMISSCTTTQQNFHAIPPRADSAITGTEFINRTIRLKVAAREAQILHEARLGNIPNFLRKFWPITFYAKDARGTQHKVTMWVTKDYLALGSDMDFIRIPMNPLSAQRIADHFGCILPTRRMVDIIYREAKIKLSPQPLSPGPKMTSNNYYVIHNKMIAKQLAEYPHDGIIAGHKKDVVISNRLNRKARRVAIYGWHRKNSRAIQPLSTVHDYKYADYSHGIRLIRNMIQIDGKNVPIAWVLQNPILYPILSDEGIIINTRVRTEYNHRPVVAGQKTDLQIASKNNL